MNTVLTGLQIFFFLCLFLHLSKNSNCFRVNRDTLHYLYLFYNPRRNLLFQCEIVDIYSEAVNKYFQKNTISKESFHIMIESCLAEFLLLLVEERIYSSDVYIRVHITNKIKSLYNLYLDFYPEEMKKDFIVSLSQQTVDIISEIDADIFLIYKDIHNIFKLDTIFITSFEDYIRNRNKIVLNLQNVDINELKIENFLCRLKNQGLEYKCK